MRLREDAEKLVQEQNYAEALKKIQEASQLRSQDPVIASLKDEIEKLFKEHDVNQKAETAYEKAQEALGDKRYDDARKLIGEALRYKPGELAYEVFKQLIDTQEKLDTHESDPPKPQTPSNNGASSSSSRKAGASRTVTINGVDVVFRWCPPGDFMMGSPTSEKDRYDDETQHKVVITKGFWLAETETTQAFWKAVMGKDNNPSRWKGDNLPVERVSWDDCQDFIKKLNEKTKDKGLQFRLPSEAHWEYACRAGSTTAYWWGNDPEDGKGKANVADASAKKEFPDWPLYFSFDDGFVSSSPVGSFTANDWNLKDMTGNVWEWCSDWFDDYPAAGTAIDPEGPQGGLFRVFRVGGWRSDPRLCRSAVRDGFTPDSWGDDIGFRLELVDVSDEEDSDYVDLVPTNPKPGESRQITINDVNVVFRWCPPGDFMMGSPTSEKDRYDDETQHKVVITKGFWLAETETTQAFWKTIMGNNLSYFKGDNLPVENVSWDDCQEFIKKLNEAAKAEGFRFSLPSEAHWEYACRAGTTTRYSWGDVWDDSKANIGGSTKPVGSYNYANAWGLKDMHGNVWEWCEDWYDAYPTGAATDPTGPESGSDRVLRGGGWYDYAMRCRSASRGGDLPESRSRDLGFRLELDDFRSN